MNSSAICCGWVELISGVVIVRRQHADSACSEVLTKLGYEKRCTKVTLYWRKYVSVTRLAFGALFGRSCNSILLLKIPLSVDRLTD
jgi:hypothetical protein